MKKFLVTAMLLTFAFAANAWADTNSGSSTPETTPGAQRPSNIGPGDDGSTGTSHPPVPNALPPKASSSATGSGSGSSGTAGPYNPTSPTNNSGAVAQ